MLSAAGKPDPEGLDSKVRRAVFARGGGPEGVRMRAARFLVLTVLAASFSAANGMGGGVPGHEVPLRAAAPGPIEDVPGGSGEMESLRFGEDATAALLAIGMNDGLRLADWPVAPGVRRPVVLTRFDVYSPDARIVRFVGGREVELPRSPLAFFKGATADGGEPVRVVTWVDPVAGVRGGLAFGPDGVIELEPDPRAAASRGILRVLRGDARMAEGDPSGPTWTCAQGEGETAHFSVPELPDPNSAATFPTAASGPSPELPFVPTETAVLSFDTDAEWVLHRHSGSVASTISHLAALVASMTVIYERDAGSTMDHGVRILQGYTIIRATEAEDPYSDTTGGANSTKLNELTNYWETNYPRSVVKRALVALVSGRQAGSPTSSGSGIAWVGGLCNSFGYSVNQLFTLDFGMFYDMLLMAHEVGHNFGSPHTHCYADPKPDTCYGTETSSGNCHSGAASCPGSATINGITTNGTLMSYCHLIGCSPRNDNVFHPSSVSRYLLPNIAGASCLTAVSGGVVPPPPSGIGISPGSGPLGGGQSVTITGSGFTSGATVAFVELTSNNVFGGSPNTKALTGVSVVNSTTITATTPSATNTGLVDVVVMNADQQTATLRSGYTYSAAAAPPTVTAVSPNSGSTAGGTSVTITGTGFVATPTVTFGGTVATRTFVNSTTLTATAPAHAAGLVNVVVTNPDAQSGTLTNGFAYLPPPSTTRYFAITPCRLFDTRNATGPDAAAPALVAGATRTFDVSGRCGVPETAVSLAVNVTVTGPGAAGELRIFPGNGISPNPPASAIFYAPGKTRANNAVLRLATDGTATYKVQNVSAASTHFILDVSGYFLP